MAMQRGHTEAKEFALATARRTQRGCVCATRCVAEQQAGLCAVAGPLAAVAPLQLSVHTSLPSLFPRHRYYCCANYNVR